MCDPWWEESEWHRAWKERFPEDWQEISHFAENGEKHIADVKTNQGYIVEFQHSSIKSEELQAREDFYKKMVWVVDGTTRSSDKGKFEEYSEPVNGSAKVRRLRDYFDKCALLRDWSGNKAPVFFDFGEDVLWGLLPKTITIEGRYLVSIKRDLLIGLLLAGPQQCNFKTLWKGWSEVFAERERSFRQAGKK